ncbi:MAG: type II toxin-antitoxin system RelE/ParE family toxin [Clostridia bacterium]
MAIKYELILTDRAKHDLEDIYEYIAKSLMAEKAAEKLINKFEKNILRLENMPESCSIIEEFEERKKQYRKLIINNYVAIYRIDEENKKVYIIRIVYGGRNYLNEI